MRISYEHALQIQTEALSASAAHVSTQLERLDPTDFQTGTVCIIGMGASLNAADLLAELLRGHGRSAFTLRASVARRATNPAALADAFVLISESGDSTETIDAATHLAAGDSRPTLTITNAPQSALARLAHTHLDLGSGPDSGVYTVGVTATLQAVGLLCGWLGVAETDAAPADLSTIDGGLHAAIETAAGRISDSRMIDVVGSGTHFSSAAQTALMLREGCRIPSAAFDTHDYLHGPIEWLGPDSTCLLFGDEREIDLARFARSVGATVIHITDVRPHEASPDTIVIPSGRATATAIRETVIVQELVRLLAHAHGTPLGELRYVQADTKLDRVY